MYAYMEYVYLFFYSRFLERNGLKISFHTKENHLAMKYQAATFQLAKQIEMYREEISNGLFDICGLYSRRVQTQNVPHDR